MAGHFAIACGKTLGARDLFRILSWIVAGGKSRCCRQPLPWTLMTPELTSLGLAIWAVLAVDPPLLLPSLVIAWMLQAIALLAVPASRTATTIGMILALFGLTLSWAGLTDDIEVHLLGFALGLLVASVAWSGASDPKARFLQAATLLPPMGALLGVEGMAAALALGVIASVLHRFYSKVVDHGPGSTGAWASSLAIGSAAGAWIVWVYGVDTLARMISG